MSSPNPSPDPPSTQLTKYKEWRVQKNLGVKKNNPRLIRHKSNTSRVNLPPEGMLAPDPTSLFFTNPCPVLTWPLQVLPPGWRPTSGWISPLGHGRHQRLRLVHLCLQPCARDRGEHPLAALWTLWGRPERQGESVTPSPLLLLTEHYPGDPWPAD